MSIDCFQAKGSGYEKGEGYLNAKIKFLGIDNIHAVRESFRKLHYLCNPPGKTTQKHWFANLGATKWEDHIRSILKGAIQVVQIIKSNNSVVIHCSDGKKSEHIIVDLLGWDRTSQVSALAQLLLDPYYRTLKGFEILIEKEWLMFGHKV